MDDLFDLTPAIEPNPGLAPSQAGSLETSRTRESSQATPVPALVERETMPNLLSPSQTDQLGLPRVHIQRADLNSEEVRVAAAILDSQWTLFMKARAANNTQLMRAALMQAYTNQLVLLQLVGQEEMMKLSHDWSAKAELDKLEAQMLSQQSCSEMIVDQDLSCHPTHLEAPRQAPGYSPYRQATPNPVSFTAPPPPIDQGQQTTQPTTIPPQESSRPFAPEQASVYPHTTQSANQIPPHHLGYPPSYNPSSQHAGYHPQGGYLQPPSYPPPTGTENRYQHPYPSPYRRPNSNQGRGRGRNNNWNRNQDSTSNMMEIGSFFVRAERALNAIQRRGRGRGSRRQHRGHNQAQTNNANPPA
jgi:hypothetical protein